MPIIRAFCFRSVLTLRKRTFLRIEVLIIRPSCERSVLTLHKRTRKGEESVPQFADGGAAGIRTPIHTKPRIRLYKLSPLRQALRRFGQVNKRCARFELHLFLTQRRKSAARSTPKMMSLLRLGDSAQDTAALN